MSVLAACNISFIKTINYIEVQKYQFGINGLINRVKLVKLRDGHFRYFFIFSVITIDFIVCFFNQITYFYTQLWQSCSTELGFCHLGSAVLQCSSKSCFQANFFMRIAYFLARPVQITNPQLHHFTHY